ncbi:unnamed protein product [Caenorhabditis auriculariae]|uniref:IBR domain-containing protein n=1 Tax=Caenorhabditis auriculariae TaxID=2777116 RepID=A0A8S1HB32_9PELO|nr:unnamed protein product [Caenorhabditis auriculariae]
MSIRSRGSSVSGSFSENSFLASLYGYDFCYFEDWDDVTHTEEVHYQVKNRANLGSRKKIHHRVKTLYFERCKDDCVLIKDIANNDYSLSNKTAKWLTNVDRVDEMDFFPRISYSVNKRRRWELKEKPKMILENAVDTLDLDAYVIERNITDSPGFFVRFYDRNPNISQIHTLRKTKSEGDLADEWEFKTITTRGNGQKFNHFRPENRELSKKKDRKLGCQCRVHGDGEPRYPACVLYSFYTPFENINRTSSRRFKCCHWGRGEQRYERRKEMERDMIADMRKELKNYRPEEETEENIDEPSVSHWNRDHVFNLEDHYVEKFVHVKNKKNRKAKKSRDDFEVEDEPEIDMNKALAEPYIYEDFNFSVSDDFNLEKEIDEMDQDALKIDQNHFIVDLTSKVSSFKNNGSGLKVGLKLFAKERILRLTLNTVFTKSKEITEDQLQSSFSDFSNISNLLEIVVATVAQWKGEEKYPRCKFSSPHAGWQNSKTLAKESKVMSFSEILPLAKKFHVMKREEDWEDVNLGGDIENATCSTCSEKDIFELIDLQSSITCRRCLEKRVRQHLRSGFDETDLEIKSEQVFDLLPVILPLPVYNFYVKQIVAKNLGYDFYECPQCCSILHSEEENDFHTTYCSTCGFSWCLICGREPHWPMKCEDFKLWKSAWEIQFAIESGETVEVMKITCECHRKKSRKVSIFEIYSKTPYAECPNCGLGFDPQKMRTTQLVPENPSVLERFLGPKKMVPIGRNYHPKQCYTAPVDKPRIRRFISQNCAEARRRRLNSNSEASLRTTCNRNWKKSNNENFKRVPEFCRTVQQLVENTLGWIYMEKIQAEGVERELGKLLIEQKFLAESALANRINSKELKELENRLETVAPIGTTLTSYRGHFGYLQGPPQFAPTGTTLSIFKGPSENDKKETYSSYLNILMEPNKRKNVNLLVLVNTLPLETNLRQQIRNSWAQQTEFDSETRVEFFMGKSSSANFSALEAEQDLHDDLAIMDFEDDYKTLAVKTFAMMDYKTRKYPGAKCFMKTDSDNVLMLRNFQQICEESEAPVIMGNCHVPRTVFRWGSKWAVPTFVYDRPFYPYYCSSGVYILVGKDVPKQLLNAAMKSEFPTSSNFRKLPEDVIFTGILPEKIGLKRRHIGGMSFVKKISVLCRNQVQYTYSIHMLREKDPVKNYAQMLELEGMPC